jgi:hypothetical protein
MSKMPPKPWHTIHIDFLDPLPTGELLLVATDAYSGYLKVEIVHLTEALIPKLVASDNGPPFNGNEIGRFMEIHGIEYSTITTLWPQGNSEAMSFMKPLLKSILTARTEGVSGKRSNTLFSLTIEQLPIASPKWPPPNFCSTEQFALNYLAKSPPPNQSTSTSWQKKTIRNPRPK